MIKCFMVLCLMGQADVCQSPIEIIPVDHIITSPMECLRGGVALFSQNRMVERGSEPQGSEPQGSEPQWFVKMYSRLEGNGSDIIREWVDREADRQERMRPQIE